MEQTYTINGITKTETEWLATYRSMKRWDFEALTGIRNLRQLQAVFTQADTPASNPAPPTVALWRIKAAMDLQGITTTVEAAINSLPDPNKTIALAGWNNGASVSRDSELVGLIAAAVPLTDAEVDNLFITAYELPS